MIYSNYKENTNEQENENEDAFVEASVKWYNPYKGYGFLSYHDDFPQEIMIHFSQLEGMGCAYIKPGDRVICEVSSGKSGLRVKRVVDVKLCSSEERTLSTFIDPRFPAFDPENVKEVEGLIKWYNPDKGYGFITPLDKSREIFFHYSILKTTGYLYLEPGAHVRAKVVVSERGIEARGLTILSKDKAR